MNFKDLNLSEELLRAIDDMGFEKPSEVQEKSIPELLEKKTDLVALAQTGTGKTAAFGFPLIQQIDLSQKTTQGLILSPTRELCLQISKELELYSKYIDGLRIVAVYGGASISDQARQLKRGAHIIVATPGRMQDMINRNIADVSDIDYCVLDEADEMLNMGFYKDITSILSYTPNTKNTWLFSATMPKEVSIIAKKFMSNPVEVQVGTRNSGNENITHEYYVVTGRDRYLALKRLADFNPDIFSVVFCRTKRDTQSVAEKLIADGYNAAAIHGDLSQNQRDMVMKSFRNNQIRMLVATDVAARGIDVDNITHVVNYQLPDEVETYVHRSGRTGRAGNKGVSIIIMTKSEGSKVKKIERIIKKSLKRRELPSGIEICEKQLFYLAKGIKDTEVNPEIELYLPEIYKLLENIDKEELIKKVVSVEFTRFLNYYKKEKDLSSVKFDSTSKSSGSSRRNKNEARFFINLGGKDGFDWMSMKDFIKEELNLGKDDVFKVDVMDGFSFFNVEIEYEELALNAFDSYEYKGRTVNIEKSKTTSNPNRRNGGGGRFGDKKRNSSKSNFGGRKDGRGGNSSRGGGFRKRR